MNIRIDARFINASGIGVYIQNLLKGELLQPFELELLYRKENQSYFEALTQPAKMIEYEAGMYSVKELIQSPLKTLNADIYWATHYNVPYFNFASKLKIVTIHDVYHKAFYDQMTFKQKKYVDLMMQRALNSSDIIFTPSNFSKQEILKYYKCDPGKIHPVHLGIDQERFARVFTDAQKHEILKQYNIEKPYVLFVGNVKPHKNLKMALSGYKEFINNNSSFSNDLDFLIVGKKEGFNTNDAEINAVTSDPFFKNRVKFTGWVNDSDLPAIYQGASVFIFPSLYEGFGFPPLEAMAARIPVAASSIPCVTEMCGDAAVYFDPLNVNSIAGALHTCLRERETTKTIERGVEQSLKYNWQNTLNTKSKIIKAHL